MKLLNLSQKGKMKLFIQQVSLQNKSVSLFFSQDFDLIFCSSNY